MLQGKTNLSFSYISFKTKTDSTLNQFVKVDNHPLPLIEQVLDCLEGVKHLATLDLTNGFYQQEIEPSSRRYTAFVTPWHVYQFKRSPMGLSISPSTFQRGITKVLEGGIGSKCYVFIDDIVVFGKSKEEFRRNLNWVCEKLSEYEQYRARGGTVNLITMIEVDNLPLYYDVTGAELTFPTTDAVVDNITIRAQGKAFIEKVEAHFGTISGLDALNSFETIKLREVTDKDVVVYVKAFRKTLRRVPADELPSANLLKKYFLEGIQNVFFRTRCEAALDGVETIDMSALTAMIFNHKFKVLSLVLTTSEEVPRPILSFSWFSADFKSCTSEISVITARALASTISIHFFVPPRDL
ncbi:hypothetical protein ADUPG1_012925 [Aduncisulcus paluster]|uniref:Reverse transcriptase domain-containing protein n=1 Tax=Aduncisulcus paluster TaxID=2918883 RepID=A0ABQ5K4E2_9EUKA|nr:hypothetical protein ADUPG1_012925 [Aduncisulcus paluster]